MGSVIGMGLASLGLIVAVLWWAKRGIERDLERLAKKEAAELEAWAKVALGAQGDWYREQLREHSALLEQQRRGL